MRDAFYQIWSEFLDAILRGIMFGVFLSVAFLITFICLRSFAVFHKAAKLWATYQ